MKDRVIVTSAIGEKYQAIWDLTRPTFESYADRVGADLVVLENNPHNVSPHWVKFAIHNILHKMYRRALWLDADIIIRPDAPDLFDTVPEDKLGIFNEGRYTPRAIAIYEAMVKYKVALPDWDRISYYNTGVMVVSQAHRHLFNNPEDLRQQNYSFGEQTYLNLRILGQAMPVHELHHHFNHMSIMDRLTGVSRLASYFIHYAGYPSPDLLATIRDDLRRWGEGEYQHEPTLFLNIGGGLGDQVCAEPVVRYIRQTLYPTATIHAISAYPDLFRHIPHLKVADVMPTEEYDAVYSMDMHPDKRTPHSQYTTYAFTHPVDYASLATLRRTLPAAAKEVHTDMWRGWVDEVFRFYADLERVVLVHPGKGWPSKTFPTAWWQEVIDGLAASGHLVGIIGKTISEEHGYLPVTVPPGGVDFRDKLSTMGLSALLHYAPVLISNDSAPVHLAGAHDNWIVLIPTCKHPEHLLPYRQRSIWYKTAALYKALAVDDYHLIPTTIEAYNPMYPVRDLTCYLPDPGDVVHTANLMTEISRTEGTLLSRPISRKGNDHEYHAIQPNGRDLSDAVQWAHNLHAAR